MRISSQGHGGFPCHGQDGAPLPGAQCSCGQGLPLHAESFVRKSHMHVPGCSLMPEMLVPTCLPSEALYKSKFPSCSLFKTQITSFPQSCPLTRQLPWEARQQGASAHVSAVPGTHRVFPG